MLSSSSTTSIYSGKLCKEYHRFCHCYELFVERLAEALPKGDSLILHHFTTLPQPCPPLFSSPNHGQEEITHCEPHFLCVSIDNDSKPVHAFAIEVLIFTTARLTTVFVSKADSTGCLGPRKLPKGIPSLLRVTLSIFLEYLVESRQKKGIRLVLSLFARAQAQYLFPGSIENSNKHVLDDRSLIKWWCRVLDSVLQQYPSTISSASDPASESSEETISRGFLRVPGCDKHETRSFSRAVDPDLQRWEPSDPLRMLGKPPGLPERCLIPRFPDDPKARFMIDLDDELPENGGASFESPTKQVEGKWRSVRSLDQFWELMSFRQECAAGRLVGFIWGVFTPASLIDRPLDATYEEDTSPDECSNDQTLPTPEPSQEPDFTASAPPQSPPGTNSPDLQKTATLTPATTPKTNSSAYCLSPAIYSSLLHHLETLDYSSIGKATESTANFLAFLGKDASAGQFVKGKKVTTPTSTASERPVETDPVPIAVLGDGLMRKKKRKAENTNENEAPKLIPGESLHTSERVATKLRI